jgi:hypothetical protein
MTHPTAKPHDPNFPPYFHVAVDVVALTIKRNLLQVAVVRRHDPMSCIMDKRTGIATEVTRKPTDYALPGGHVKWENEKTLCKLAHMAMSVAIHVLAAQSASPLLHLTLNLQLPSPVAMPLLPNSWMWSKYLLIPIDSSLTTAESLEKQSHVFVT